MLFRKYPKKKIIWISFDGYSLVFTVAICLIICVLCLSALTLLDYHYALSQKSFIKEKNNRNINDVQKWIESNLDKSIANAQDEFNISDAEIVETDITKYGLLTVVRLRAIYYTDTLKRAFFLGYERESDYTGIYIPQGDYRISLVGQNNFCGRIQVPQGSFKNEYLPGKARNELNSSCISFVPPGKELPEFIKTDELNNLLSMENSTILSSMEGSYHNSFFSNKLSFYKKEDIYLGSGNDFRGNIFVRSDSRIVVNAACNLRDVILMAPQVFIESGFAGNIQIIAEDTVAIGEKAQLIYPSAIYLTERKDLKPSSIWIGAGAIVDGLIYANNANGLVKLEKTSQVRGILYNSGTINLEGTIFGSLFTKKMIRQVGGVNYLNYFIDNTIDPTKLSIKYLDIASVSKTAKLKLLKWVK